MVLPVEQTWMSALLKVLEKTPWITSDAIYLWKMRGTLSESVQELTPSSLRKTQAHDGIAKLFFLKNKGQNSGIKAHFATSSTRCPATGLEKHPRGAALQTLYTYQDVGRSTWDQCWNVACKTQLAGEVLWCCQPESYCRAPLCKLKGCWSVGFSTCSRDTRTAFHWRGKCHQHKPSPELLAPLAWDTYTTLSAIHFSSCLVIFCNFHSVKLATKTPGLKEQVLAFMASFRMVSFL